MSRALSTRPLRYLGEISYSIYMVNVLIFEIATFAWAAAGRGRFGASFSVGEAWATWPLALALVVAVSHVTYRWIEVPARTWLRRRDPFPIGPAPEFVDGTVRASS